MGAYTSIEAIKEFTERLTMQTAMKLGEQATTQRRAIQDTVERGAVLVLV
jgi:hypothetical protein